MKFFIFSTLLIIGLHLTGCCEGHIPEPTGKHGALKRVVRQATMTMGETFLFHTEGNLIAECKSNGIGNETVAEGLENSYDELKRCVAKKVIFKDSKNDFISNMEQCAQEPIRKTEQCLKENQKYFPKFILDLAKSVIQFTYDDYDILKVDLVPCAKKFGDQSVQQHYLKCLDDKTSGIKDNNSLPNSKENFCEKFIPVSECFPDTIKDKCDNTPKIVKFSEDYMKAIKEPCGMIHE